MVVSLSQLQKVEKPGKTRLVRNFDDAGASARTVQGRGRLLVFLSHALGLGEWLLYNVYPIKKLITDTESLHRPQQK